MTNRALDEYSESPEEQEKLARRLGLANVAEFHTILQQHTQRARELFETFARHESGGSR